MDSQIEMNKASLKKLSKSKLIKLLLNQKKRKPENIIADDTKSVPTQPLISFDKVPEINPLAYLVKYLRLTFPSSNQQLSQQHSISYQM